MSISDHLSVASLDSDRALPVFRVNAVVEPDGDGTYYGHCPEIGCIHVSGDTPEETEETLSAAIKTYLTMSIRNGDPIPIGVQAQRPMRRRPTTATSDAAPRAKHLDVSLHGALAAVP